MGQLFNLRPLSCENWNNQNSFNSREICDLRTWRNGVLLLIQNGDNDETERDPKIN